MLQVNGTPARYAGDQVASSVGGTGAGLQRDRQLVREQVLEAVREMIREGEGRCDIQLASCFVLQVVHTTCKCVASLCVCVCVCVWDMIREGEDWCECVYICVI